MKILIDIGHPAHIHYFKNFTKLNTCKGHEVLFTCRDKEVIISLLKHYNLNYSNFGKPFKSKLGKIWGLLYFTLKTLIVSYKFKPDIYLNATMYSAITAWIMNKPHIAFEDTYNMEQVRIYRPFSSCILTGDYPHPSLGDKEIKYRGYHELAYLHPKRFIPNKTILEELGVEEDEKYVIIRFVSWNASHDTGHTGISYENKQKAITEFSKYSKVFISSESELPNEFQKYKINIDPYRMHDAMAFATLLFGESSTMSEEAAMLGVPSIYLFDNSTYYTQHLENKYNLIYNYSESELDQQIAIEKGIELLKESNLKGEWRKRRDKMLSDKIDVTAFMVWFVENYPESEKIMKVSPNYQFNFK